MSANTEQYRESRADWTIADPGSAGAIPNDTSGICVIDGTVGTTRTLARPTKVGITLTLSLKAVTSSITVTVTGGYNESGDTSLLLSSAGAVAQLVSVMDSTTTYGWRMVGGDPIELGTITAATGSFTTLGASGVCSMGEADCDLLDVNCDALLNTGGFTVTGAAAVSQSSSITTAVAIADNAGTITTQTATTAASATDTFAITGTGLAATDLFLFSYTYSGTLGTHGIPVLQVTSQGSNTMNMTIANAHASNALNGTFVINYLIIKRA